MKKHLLLFLMILWSAVAYAQQEQAKPQDTVTYRIIKTDGGELIGKILQQDEREILLQSRDGRKIYVPQHLIKEMIALKARDFNAKGEFVGEDDFSTRYFLTTNGLPVKPGKHYMLWSWIGPDIQFGLKNNVGVGLITTWVGIPLIASVKKSFTAGPNSQVAVGALIATGSWAAPKWGGALPYVTLSFGDRQRNIAFSAGYGAIWNKSDTRGQALGGMAGMVKVSPKLSLVLDSFFGLGVQGEQRYDILGAPIARNRTVAGFVIPGLRWHQSEKRALQFGFTGVVWNGEFKPFPIPMIQYFTAL